MRRTLLVTNDFPPRAGGIQSYLHELTTRLPKGGLVVYAPAWPGAVEFDAAQPFPVFRHPTSLMLPVPTVGRRARELLLEHRLQGVWFGAAAPLALLGPSLRRAGAQRVVACSHGHEVGWSMIPGARNTLRSIGRSTDVITFVSRYARRRISAALGPSAALEYLPPGVDTAVFRPDSEGRRRIRDQLGIGDRPVIACISRLVRRKGQDVLIAALSEIRRQVPDAVLMIVGGGSDGPRLEALAVRHGVTEHVLVVGSQTWSQLPQFYAAADVFAMPCRTRGGGLDVEGLGIVFLEASATGLPVVAGDSGGAPEAVRQERTGLVVDGRSVEEVAAAVAGLLTDSARRTAFGRAGREWVERSWNWQSSADRLAALLDG